MKHRDGSLEKSARLIVLMEMQDKGLLESLSLQQIANLFPDKPHRSTIMRDLRDVEQLRKTLKAMRSSRLLTPPAPDSGKPPDEQRNSK